MTLNWVSPEGNSSGKMMLADSAAITGYSMGATSASSSVVWERISRGAK